jgi:hypothetical protein
VSLGETLVASKLQLIPEQLGTYGWRNVAPMFLCSWLADVPSVFIGNPGSAKTTFHKRFCEALGLKVEVLDLQYLTTTRLLGLPHPESLKQEVLKYVGGVADKKPDVVIFEELNRCFDHVQGIILEFIREGRLDQNYIKCKRICNCNPPSNVLVGVHFLDYAQATRLVNIPVPDLTTALWDRFIDDWQVSFKITPEAKTACKEVTHVKLVQPDNERLKLIAFNLLNSIPNIPVSGRQIDNLLRLLSASWSFEVAGLHKFKAIDLGRLCASLIPYQLTRNNWDIKDFETFATTLSSKLPNFPWSAESFPKTQNLSVEVETLQLQYQKMDLPELLTVCFGTDLSNFIAFEVFVSRAASDPAYDIEFDGWEALKTQLSS